MKLNLIKESDDSLKLLRQLCSTRRPKDKVDLIKSTLGGDAKLVPYRPLKGRYIGQTFYNIYAHIDAGKDKTIAITCHHDIVNAESENCLDNNSSVFNLIRLYNILKSKPKEDLFYNIVAAFVDAEESVDPYASGIGPLLRAFDIDQLIDFELTAGGSNIVMQSYGQFDILDYPIVKMPYNNAKIASHFRRQGVKCRGSVCLTMVTDEDLAEIEANGYCNRWGQCHKVSDTVDSWANIEDMDRFISVIVSHVSI